MWQIYNTENLEINSGGTLLTEKPRNITLWQLYNTDNPRNKSRPHIHHQSIHHIVLGASVMLHDVELERCLHIGLIGALVTVELIPFSK